MKWPLYMLLLSLLSLGACAAEEHKALKDRVAVLEDALRMEERLSDQRQRYIDKFYDDRVTPLLRRQEQVRLSSEQRVFAVGRPVMVEPGTLPGQSGRPTSLRVQHLYTDSLSEYLLPQVVLFESGQARLSQIAQDSLGQLIPFLQQAGKFTLIVEGHTDNTEARPEGGDSWDLSMARAQATARFLIAQGISPAVIQLSARGRYAPRASNVSLADKALNRRVDIYLSPLSRYP